jgi:hypothetical protein
MGMDDGGAAEDATASTGNADMATLAAADRRPLCPSVPWQGRSYVEIVMVATESLLCPPPLAGSPRRGSVERAAGKKGRFMKRIFTMLGVLMLNGCASSESTTEDAAVAEHECLRPMIDCIEVSGDVAADDQPLLVDLCGTPRIWWTR